MAAYVKSGCPVCGCADCRAMGAVREANPPVPVAPGSAIVRCKHCKLIYVDPMPHWSESDFQKLYGPDYFTHLHTAEKGEWAVIRAHLNPRARFLRLAPYLKSDLKRVLEIGAGDSAFMCRYLLKQGWDATAQEPGEAFQAALRTVEGLRVEPRDVMALSGETPYSLVYADSVLEHVPDPQAYYQKLATLLAPGGVLYTVSPNEYSMYNFILNFRARARKRTPHYIAPYQPPYHLIGFTKQALGILGDMSGLRLAEYRKRDDYMSYHMRTSAHNPVVKYPFAGLLALSEKVGLGANGEAIFLKS